MKRTLVFFFFLITASASFAQRQLIDSFSIAEDVSICIDRPARFSENKKTILIFFALPNGNSIPQTMGKQLKTGDDWHYDIQHIKAQTAFIRQRLKKENIVIAYAANKFKAWPMWKQKHPGYSVLIKHIIDTVASLFDKDKTKIYLNGHSGGGSFIFGYLQGLETIPATIERISFLDSDYGYDSSYSKKIINWLQESKSNHLSVFAYNDSVALYNGKPVVSATGGTWYRSHLMLQHLTNDFSFKMRNNDSLVIYKTNKGQVQFFFKTNPGRKIFHTQQVELNGFIHSVLCGTRYDSKGYQYYGNRAYSDYIEE